MTLIIETWWSKVVADPSAPFGTRVLPEYERKDIVRYPNGGGWNSREEWQRSLKGRKGFIGLDEQGRAKFDQGRTYGIHSYQLVSLEVAHV